jgi:putative ABC transport system ATP-binding protein
MQAETIRPPGLIVIDIENITKHYIMGEETVHALRGVTLQIHRNEYLAIMGPSGSGKSTLMNMLGCLDTPSSGRYEFNGKNVSEMDGDELAAIRNREIGFVFQTFNLLPGPPVCAMRNRFIRGIDPEARGARWQAPATSLGDRLQHKPELSGDSASVTAGLSEQPFYFLADEPI